jgi:hypothetical protein
VFINKKLSNPPVLKSVGVVVIKINFAFLFKNNLFVYSIAPVENTIFLANNK